jgi:hypothetical protein
MSGNDSCKRQSHHGLHVAKNFKMGLYLGSENLPRAKCIISSHLRLSIQTFKKDVNSRDLFQEPKVNNTMTTTVMNDSGNDIHTPRRGGVARAHT